MSSFLAGRVEQCHRPIENVHLEVERVDESRVDRCAVEGVVGDTQEARGA
jgi:hypothetical protein